MTKIIAEYWFVFPYPINAFMSSSETQLQHEKAITRERKRRRKSERELTGAIMEQLPTHKFTFEHNIWLTAYLLEILIWSKHNNLANKWKWIHLYYYACHVSACEICNSPVPPVTLKLNSVILVGTGFANLDKLKNGSLLWCAGILSF